MNESKSPKPFKKPTLKMSVFRARPNALNNKKKN